MHIHTRGESKKTCDHLNPVIPWTSEEIEGEREDSSLHIAALTGVQTSGRCSNTIRIERKNEVTESGVGRGVSWIEMSQSGPDRSPVL